MRTAAIASAALVAAACGVRRVSRRSGVTASEAGAPLPGDEIVENPMWESTRAITIDATAGDVWPWIVQMGYPRFRAGWYTPHWLDRLQWGIREGSAGRIRSDLQHLEVGDRIPDSPDWSVFFTVEHVEPRRALVLHSTRHLIKPMRAIDFSWAFVLDSAAGDRTRLIMRARARCQPRAAWLALGALIGIGDFVNAAVCCAASSDAASGLRRRGRPPRPWLPSCAAPVNLRSPRRCSPPRRSCATGAGERATRKWPARCQATASFRTRPSA